MQAAGTPPGCLHSKAGLTLGELCEGLEMPPSGSREASRDSGGSQSCRDQTGGREKLHFINRVPINEIAKRWISKFEQPRLHALAKLKRSLEGESHG